MGYSNNKWRKILTILMIINLCFVLFAKFTKVFGVTTYSNILQSDIGIPNWLYGHDFCVSIFNNQGGYYNLTVSYFDNYKVYYDNSRPNYYIFDNSKTFKQFSITNSKNTIINTLANLTESQFSNQNNIYIMPNSSSYETFYNFKIYDYNNRDTVYKDPNTTIFVAPFFDNVSAIQNGYPNGVFVSRGSYSEDDTLYFHLLKITETVTDNNQTIYYYSPTIFALNNKSNYYRTWDNDPNNDYSYYYIDRANLRLDTNSSYLYVLTNSSQMITNSYGILQKDISNGIYDVVQSDTTGVITSQDSINDKIKDIDDTLDDNTVSDDTQTNIDDSLDFNNQNTTLNNLNNGFFSRLTSMLSSIIGYDLSEDTPVEIPLPHSQKKIILHSNLLYNHVTGGLRVIINAFWLYIFTFYLWRFINKIYIAVSTGNILDTFSSSDEAITNNML